MTDNIIAKPQKYSSIRHQIQTIIVNHEGRARAITARQLAEITHQPERRVRLNILALIREERAPILSSTESPAGYFYPSTFNEWKLYDQTLRSRIIEDAKRKSYIKRNIALYFKSAEQGRLL